MNRIATGCRWLVKVLKSLVATLRLRARQATAAQKQAFAESVRSLGIAIFAGGIIALAIGAPPLWKCLTLISIGVTVMLYGVLIAKDR